ncbi:MAG: hypothetical protein AAB209_08255, partial [Bacteroidota bacterium]
TLRVKEPAQVRQPGRKEKSEEAKPAQTIETAKPTTLPTEEPPRPNLLAKADSLYAVAVSKYTAGELAAAKAGCEEALALYKNANSNAKIGKVQRMLATILFHQDVLSIAKQMFEEAESMLQRAGEREEMALATIGRARVFVEQKKSDEAESMLKQTVAKNPEGNAAAGMYGLLSSLAVISGKTDDGRQYLQQADRQHVRGRDAMIDMLLEIARARYDAASGKTAAEMRTELQTAVARAGDVASSLEMKYTIAELASEYLNRTAQPRFQRNPRRGAMQSGQRVEAVRSEAASKGFTLIARKTSELPLR